MDPSFRRYCFASIALTLLLFVPRLFAQSGLADGLKELEEKHPSIREAQSVTHLGSLGGGNHFIEICLDEEERVWAMLHSGSRGIGNRIGTFFIARAREALDRRQLTRPLPDRDLAWLEEGEPLFEDYVAAVAWAQEFARHNREVMMAAVLRVMRDQLPAFDTKLGAVVGKAAVAHREQADRSCPGDVRAAQVADVLVRTPGDVIELGPGTGRLAADILEALAARDVLPARYLLLEVSPDLRARQRAHLQRHVPALAARVEWIDVLPTQRPSEIVNAASGSAARTRPAFNSTSSSSKACGSSAPSPRPSAS